MSPTSRRRGAARVSGLPRIGKDTGMARHLFLTLTVALTAVAAGCAHCDTCDDFPAPANVAYGAPIPGGEGGPILAPAPPLAIGQDIGAGVAAETSGTAHMAVPHYQSAPSPPALPQLPSAPGAGSGPDVKKVPDEKMPELPADTDDNAKSGSDAAKTEASKADGNSGATPKADKGEEITKPIVPIP